jgi:hypothetical protein
MAPYSVVEVSYITQEEYNMNFHRSKTLRSCIIQLSESYEVGLAFGAYYVDEECLKYNVKASSERHVLTRRVYLICRPRMFLLVPHNQASVLLT